ncbi:MAG: hypothetical protein Hyperionvirus4_23 [Hyperionvirus sp.]|uniref:Uncharacterized protein n=1 Tax=Hyperionvirus sp. TaxID=2487770 RepID=A0A3G5A7A5_9VIRU|nr:MAG: hypothetical protein Hyperionvirus4_23 [Hyperionvirus sp.]
MTKLSIPLKTQIKAATKYLNENKSIQSIADDLNIGYHQVLPYVRKYKERIAFEKRREEMIKKYEK